MTRMHMTGLGLWLAAALLLATAPAAAAAGPDGSVFAGTWVSIDSDGSTQALSIGRGATPAVTYQDFYASSCANAGAQSTHFVATGMGAVDGDSMSVAFRNGGCGWRKIGPFELAFSFDGSSGTVTDEFGITWYRFP